MPFQGFGKGALDFFDELAANNNRDWWLAHKEQYEAEIREPLEQLLQDLASEFGEAKVFRPNRDVRFSADKSPYKTQAAAVIHGDPAKGEAGSLYMALSATGLMTGGGSYMPAKDQLDRLRRAIVDDRTGKEVEGLIADVVRHGGRVEAHEALKTAPRGYPADHPRIELLRWKGMTGFFEHGPAKWLHTARARDQVADDWRALGPLNAWLDRNVGPSDLPPRTR